MSNSFAGLRDQLEQLVESFEKLGVRLAESARGLREEAIPPEAMLVEEITVARERFSDFQDALMRAAQSATAPESQLNGNTGSLRGLRELLETLERQEAEMRQLHDRALGLLDDVMRLEYRGASELPDLRDCQERAAALRHRIAASSTIDSSILFAPEMLPEIMAIANRETAFADLLDLVKKRETLDGQTATSLSLKVEEAFGRRIFIEALLGRIVFSESKDHPTEPAPQPASPPPTPPPAPAPSLPPTEALMPTTRRLEDKAPALAPPTAAVTLESSEPIELIPLDEAEAPTPDLAILPELEDVLEETEHSFRFTHDSAIDLAESAQPVEEADSPHAIDRAAGTRQTVPLREIDGFPNQRQTEKFAVPVSGEDQPTLPETLGAELVSAEEFEKIEEIAVEAPVEIEAEVEQEAPWLRRVTGELKHGAAFQTAGSARETANAILRSDSSLWLDNLSTLLWQMLAEDELPLAFHLTRAITGVYPEAPFRTPSHLIRALALARHVRYDNGEIATTLRHDLSGFDATFFTALEAEPDEDWQQAIHLALAAATLPTALLAPSAEADAVLASVRLNNQLESLAGYCRTVFEFAMHKQPLDLRSIAKAPDPLEWQADLSALVQRVKDWMEQAPRLDLESEMAQRIWLRWIGPRGKIGAMLQPVLRNDARQMASALSGIEELSFDTNVEWAVDQTNREIRGSDAPAIAARCIEQIGKQTRQAIELAQAWIALLQSYPPRRSAEAINRAHDLKETLDQVRDGALADLDRFKQSHRNPFLSGAATLCLRAIETINQLLSSGDPFGQAGLAASRASDSISRILNADLLRVADIAMNERWEPDMVSDGQIIRGVVETIAEPRSDWARAFERRVQHEDHEATQRILEYLAGQCGFDFDLEALAAERNRCLQQCRESLQSTAESLRREIETAVLNGWLDEQERAHSIAEIEHIVQALPATLRFFEQNAKLKSLKLNLETHCARKRAEKGNTLPLLPDGPSIRPIT